MGQKSALKAAVLLTIIILFSTCGELETLVPSNGSYQIKTLVNNASLEDCSIIRSSDKIRPYFNVSVAHDPDLIGLSVYLQNDQGEIIGQPIHYILESYAQEPVPTETEDEPPVEPSADLGQEEEEPVDDKAEKVETEEWKHEAEGEQWLLADTKSADTSTGTEIPVRSLAQELPYFSFPQTLKLGSYTLVFEAVGKKETLSRMETDIFYMGSVVFNLKDIAMYLPGLSNSQLVSPGTTVMLEPRLDYDKRLDPYVIWYNGKNIISEGRIHDGAGTILWKAPEQAGFSSLRLEVFPFRLKRNLAGLSREIALPVSPKAEHLNYFFKKDSPFYQEDAQRIPALLNNQDSAQGSTQNSAEDEDMPSAELLCWYQFEGSLDDSKAAFGDIPSLLPPDQKIPRWAGTGLSYGLSVEKDDIYQITPIKFFRTEKDQGGGVFLLHIRPPAEGSILNAFFPFESLSTDGARIEVIKERNLILLRLSAGVSTGASAIEMPLYLADSESRDFIPIMVEFYIRPYRMEAKISMGGGHYLQSEIGTIDLPGALSGDGRMRMGGIAEKPENISVLPTIEPVFDESISALLPAEQDDDPAVPEINETLNSNTIWDELAILFSPVALLPEEIPEADAEQETIADNDDEKIIAETEAAPVAHEEPPTDDSLAENNVEGLEPMSPDIDSVEITDNKSAENEFSATETGVEDFPLEDEDEIPPSPQLITGL